MTPSRERRLVPAVALQTALLAALVSAGRADDLPFPMPRDCVAAPESEAAARAIATYWFEQGVAQVARDEFAEAVRSFACAHAIIPHPATLYNLGRAAEWAGDLPTAVRALRMYLDASPDLPDRAEIEAKVARFEFEIAIAAEAEVTAEAEPSGTEEAETPGGERRLGSRAQRVAGWASVGIAAAGAVVGSVFAGFAADQRNRIDEMPDGTPWVEVAELEETFNNYLLATWIGFGVAGAAALTGILLLVLGDDDGPDAVEVAPVVGDGAAGLALTWKF